MAYRHAAVKATLDRGYASEWNADHIENFATRVQTLLSPFVNAIADFWDSTQHTSGTSTTVTMVSGHVSMRMRGSGGAGNFATVRLKLLNAAADMTDENAQPMIQMALDVNTPTADADTHEFGLFTTANLPFAANQDGCYFLISAGVLYAVSGDGAAETITNLGAPNQFGVYMVKHTATHDYFYVDDLVTPVATHTTHLSTADLTVKLTCADRAGGDNYLNCQSVWMSFLRQTT
jgi:hypothetical protein